MKQYHYQTELISYNTGTVASNLRKEIILNSAYERCIGVGIIPVSNGGINMHKVGIEDATETIITPVPFSFLESDKAAGLKPENRLLPINMRAMGHKATMITEIPQDITAELSYYVVFQLEREQKA